MLIASSQFNLRIHCIHIPILIMIFTKQLFINIRLSSLQHCLKFRYHISGSQICSFTFKKIYKFFSNFFVTISKTSITTHLLNTHTHSPRILFKDQFVVNFRISRSLLHSHEAQTISTQNSCSSLSSSLSQFVEHDQYPLSHLVGFE